MTTANASSSCALLMAYAYQVPFHLDLLDPRLPGCTPGPKIGPNSITLLLGGANSMLSGGTGACFLWHRYADCDTDHALVRCTLPPENTWAELRGSMTEAASEVFGLCRRKQTDWFLVSSATQMVFDDGAISCSQRCCFFHCRTQCLIDATVHAAYVPRTCTPFYLFLLPLT